MWLEETVMEVLGSRSWADHPPKSYWNILLSFYKSRVKTSAGKTLVKGQ